MKTRKLLSVMAAAVLVLAMMFVMCACTTDGQDDTTGSTTGETTPADNSGAVPVLDGSVVLYFNPDRALYEGMADDALTSRPKDLEDGCFHIELSAEGKVTEFLAKKRMVVNQVDTNSAMALQLDENNNIVGIYTVEEMGGSVAIDHLYVTGTVDNTLTINTNNTFTGEELTYTMTSDVKIYDVSDKENNYGAVTTLLETDEIFAVANANGEISHIWVISRASQRNGRAGCICGVNEGTEHKEGCDGSLLYVWQPWTYETSLPTSSGYWYLDVPGKNIELNEIYRLRSSADIFLDLNGHTINVVDTSGVFFFPESAVATNLTILDSTGGGQIILNRADTTGSIQSSFFVAYGKKHVFTLYGGTIDGSRIKGEGGNGGILRSIGGTMNLYGGKVIGASGVSTTGGCIWSSGIVNIDDCVITGGNAKKGGNIYMQLDESYEAKMGVTTTLNITSGEISDGTATIAGGNICYMEDVVVNIADGTVSGGEAPKDNDINMNKKPTAAD